MSSTDNRPMGQTNNASKPMVHCGKGFHTCPGNIAHLEYIASIQPLFLQACDEEDRIAAVKCVRDRFNFYKHGRLIVNDEAFVQYIIRAALGNPRYGNDPKNGSGHRGGYCPTTATPKPAVHCGHEQEDKGRCDDSDKEANEAASAAASTSPCDGHDDNDGDNGPNKTTRPVVYCGRNYRALPGNVAYVEYIALMHDRYKQASTGPERTAVISTVRDQFEFVFQDKPDTEAFVHHKISCALSNPAYQKHLPQTKQKGSTVAAAAATAASEPERTVATKDATGTTSTTKKLLVHCGTSPRFRDQPGNRAYVEYIATRVDEYVQASLRVGGDATQCEIIDTVKDQFDFVDQGQRPDDDFLHSKIARAFLYAKQQQQAKQRKRPEPIRPSRKTSGSNKQQDVVASRKKPRIDLDEIIIVS